MASVNTARRLLGLDAQKWARVDIDSPWPAMSLVVIGSILMSLTRFGGLAFDEPRGFVRLALVMVWGWLGLATAIWLIASRARDTSQASGEPTPPPMPLHQTIAVVGLAHVPILTLSGVIFVAAGLLQLLGPGRVAAVFVFAFWFPASLTTGLRSTFHGDLVRFAVIVIVPYAVWLLIVGRHVLEQLNHLL